MLSSLKNLMMIAVPSEEPICETHTDQYPLLTERHSSHVNQHHIIDIERGGDASSSDSSDFEFSCGASPNYDGRATSSLQEPISASSSSSPSRTNFRSSSFRRTNDGMSRQNWSPLYSRFWISIELLITFCQIIASLTVLYLSRHEHPQAPLSAWIVGYTTGCFASIPVLCWHLLHCNHGGDRGAAQGTQVSPRANLASARSPYVTISLSQSLEHEDSHSIPEDTHEGETLGIANTRVGLIMDHFKMALDCFFAVWFVVGNIWIFGGHASATEVSNLYRLCIVYLTFSCIGYAMPFILCTIMCCCLPCIISVLGIREDLNQVRGASEESIISLPTYKFKLKSDEGGSPEEPNSEEVGIVAAGAEKERLISGEDAVCCVCLARYMDDDAMRELPCSHFFHSECVDRWLKINATCPLCKYVIGEGASTPETNSNQVFVSQIGS